MAMIFKFRMLSDENDSFLRDYEVPYDMNLHQFHDFICSDLKYEKEHMAAFFIADAQWDRGHEFTLLDIGEPGNPDAPTTMEGTFLGQIIRQNKDRLIWVFDLFSNRAYYLELIGTKKDESGKYPYVALAEGQVPDQFEIDMTIGSGSIFDEALGEFGDFEGDDMYDDE